MNNEDLLFERATNVDTIGGFFLQHIDQITGGLWGPAISMMVFGLVFLGLNGDTDRDFAAASFATMVTVVLLIPFGLMGSEALLLAALLVVTAIALNGGGRT